MPYQALRPHRPLTANIRNLDHHVRIWGDPAAPPLVLLHGWMDSSASWQFMVDALQRDWHIIAPDWRGFGDSQWARDGYWFPDYHADLDALLDLLVPDASVNLVGHSMGGNIACIYSGARPARVHKLVSLEGFGLPATRPEDAPQRLAGWLDSLREPPVLRQYAALHELASRMMKTNPRLTGDKAAYLAAQQSRSVAGQSESRIELKSDPRHKALNPVPYRLEEAKAAWRQVTAPTLWVQADDSELLQRFHGKDDQDLADRAACFANIRRATIADAGHMLHQDQPAQVAALLEEFLAA